MLRNRKLTSQLILYFVIVLFAYICHVIAYNSDINVVGYFFNFLRTCLYIVFFSAWGVSVYRRIMQTQVKRYLIAVASLAVFWLLLRELRYRFNHIPVLLRLIWYGYYIPIILIPLLAFLVSLSLAKSGNFRLPKKTSLLYVPAVILILLVLTNDFHFLAFRFTESLSDWTQTTGYKYGPVFFLIVLWDMGMFISAIVVMFLKSRVPNTRRYLPMIFTPFAVVGIYLLVYSINKPLLEMFYIDDLTVIESLGFISFFEICVRCGLIQSNSRYFDLFRGMQDMDVQILDNDFNAQFVSGNERQIGARDVLVSLKEPIITDDGRRQQSIRINGGFAVWTEDITELLELRETLRERHEELTERNDLLQYEYEREKQHKTIEQQNKLYDLLQSKTHSQLEKIDRLVSAYQHADSHEEKKQILAKIIVLGSYVKRRKDFVLSIVESSMMSGSKLSGAFDESYRALSKKGIGGAYLVDIDSPTASGEALALAYDFFEDVTEAVLDTAKYINVRVCSIDGGLRESVLVDCRFDADGLKAKYPSLEIYEEDDGVQLILALEGGTDV